MLRFGGILVAAATHTLWYYYEPEPRDHYEALGVAKNADIRTIKKAYRAKGLKYHPGMRISTRLGCNAFASSHFHSADKTSHSGYDTTKKFARISGGRFDVASLLTFR